MNETDSYTERTSIPDTPPGVIDQELNKLAEGVHLLRDRLHLLQSRLQASLRPDESSPSKPGGLERPLAISSQRAQRIMEISTNVDSGIRIVDNLLDRLE